MDPRVPLEGPRKRVAFAVSVALHAGLLLLLLVLKSSRLIRHSRRAVAKAWNSASLISAMTWKAWAIPNQWKKADEHQHSTPPPEGSDEQLITEEDGEAIETPPKTENPHAATP